MFEYQCYPIWIYDENGKFLDNGLVSEIEQDDNMVMMSVKLQEIFESLYQNNNSEFKYIGFNSQVDRKKFEKEVQQVYENLCALLNEKYIVKNMVDIQKI